MNQLGLFGEPEPDNDPVREDSPSEPQCGGIKVPNGIIVPSLRERLMEALRRDVDTLSSPALAAMSPDIPDLIRERVADYRQRLAEEA